MICTTCNTEAVLNSALDKQFYYCRTCKDEVKPEAVVEPSQGLTQALLEAEWLKQWTDYADRALEGLKDTSVSTGADHLLDSTPDVLTLQSTAPSLLDDSKLVYFIVCPEEAFPYPARSSNQMFDYFYSLSVAEYTAEAGSEFGVYICAANEDEIT